MRRLLKTLFLLAVGVAILSAAGCVQVPVAGQSRSGFKQAPIFGAARAGQEFYVSDRNLTRIDVFLFPSKAFEGKEDPGAKRQVLNRLEGKPLILTLYSLPERRRVVTFKQRTGKIREARMYAFVFKPIAGSKQRRYYFELSAPSLPPDLAVAVRMAGVDVYKDGAAVINGRAVRDADLTFQTYIDMTLIILSHSVAARLAGDLPFMAVWALLVIIVAAAAARTWRRVPLSNVKSLDA